MTDDLERLAADLRNAGAVSAEEARKVVIKGAMNIKADWREAWTGMAHAPALPYAITYDTKITREGIVAEIGPDKDRPQGALGNLIEFGSVKNEPRPGGQPALDREESRFVQAMENIAGKIL